MQTAMALIVQPHRSTRDAKLLIGLLGEPKVRPLERCGRLTGLEPPLALRDDDGILP